MGTVPPEAFRNTTGVEPIVTFSLNDSRKDAGDLRTLVAAGGLVETTVAWAEAGSLPASTIISEIKQQPGTARAHGLRAASLDVRDRTIPFLAGSNLDRGCANVTS